jgi:hypothetical protein
MPEIQNTGQSIAAAAPQLAAAGAQPLDASSAPHVDAGFPLDETLVQLHTATLQPPGAILLE